MTKRTKRYGGFLVGDKVKAKGYGNLNGEVTGFLNGYLKCVFDEITPRVEVVFVPNQLINLTRLEEENRKITDPLPPISEETAKEIEEHFIAFCNKNKITPPKANFNLAKEMREKDLLTNGAIGTIPPQFKLDVKSIEEIAIDYAEQKNAYDEMMLELDRLKVRDCVQYTELDINRIVAPDPLPSPYTRDVYTSTKDYD